MAKFYVAAVENLSADDERRFIEFLKKNNIDWWHWIENFWMLKDPSGKSRAEDINNVLNKLSSSTRGVVLTSTPNGYAGFFQTGNPIFEWVAENWKSNTKS